MEPKHTPQWLRTYVHENFPTAFNPVEADHFDGLNDDWPAGPDKLSFVNAPFTDTELWIQKAVKELKKGAASIVFCPAVFNSVYFRELVYPNAAEIHLFTCPCKIPGKSKQIVAQLCLVCFAARPEDVPADALPPVLLAEPKGWRDEYYKRQRNKARFAPPK